MKNKIINKNNVEKVYICLDSSDGNVFALIGIGARILSKSGYSAQEVAEFRTMMLNLGSYNDIVKHFDFLFDDFIEWNYSSDAYHEVFLK